MNRERDNQICIIESGDFYALLASCEGLAHEFVGRQDSGIAVKSECGNYILLACADGHSSAEYGREGADLFLDAVRDSVWELINDEKAAEEDMIRLFLSRSGKRKIYNFWRNLVLQNYGGKELAELSEHEILKAYGTTVNGVLITDRYLIAFSVGDGELILVRENDEVEIFNSDYGDTIETNLTFSVCELSPEVFKSRTYIRNNYKYVLLTTDGISKTYDLCNEILPQIIEDDSEMSFTELKDDILDFMLNQAADEVTDDYTMIFSKLPPKTDETGDGFKISNIFPKSDSLLYSMFPKKYQGMGKAEIGIRKLLSAKELLKLAKDICIEICEMKNDEKTICNPLDIFIKYAIEDGVNLDAEYLAGSVDACSEMASLLYPEYFFNSHKEEIFIAGVINKLVLGDELIGFAPGYVYAQSDGLSCYINDICRESVLLNEECLEYITRLYSKKLRDDEYWDAATWYIKLLACEIDNL